MISCHKFYPSLVFCSTVAAQRPQGLPPFWRRWEKSIIGISGWLQALRPMCFSTFPATWAKAKSLLVDTSSVLSNWIPSMLYTHISQCGEAFWSEICCWIKKKLTIIIVYRLMTFKNIMLLLWHISYDKNSVTWQQKSFVSPDYKDTPKPLFTL